MNNTLYEKLKSVARAGDTVTYGELGDMLGLDIKTESGRSVLSNWLGEINIAEVSHNHPMLSSVAVHEDDGLPGGGYFRQAKNLRRLREGGDEPEFHEKELQAVHKEWVPHKNLFLVLNVLEKHRHSVESRQRISKESGTKLKIADINAYVLIYDKGTVQYQGNEVDDIQSLLDAELNQGVSDKASSSIVVPDDICELDDSFPGIVKQNGKLKFFGTVQQLMRVLEEHDIDGNWWEKNGVYRFVATDGGILMWWSSTKSLSFQGKDPSRSEIARVFDTEV